MHAYKACLTNMLNNIIKSFFNKKPPAYNGLQPDLRPESEKDKDWQAKDSLVSAIPIFREVKSLSEVIYGTVRNQAQSGSCVKQALAKAIEMSMRKQGFEESDIKRVVSALYFYQNRTNKPKAGSSPVEMCEFARKNKWYRESDVTSQNMSDQEMDQYQIAKEILKVTGYEINYFTDNTPTFNETAQYIEQAGNAMMLIDTNYVNWCQDKPVPGGRGGGVRHEICGVDDVLFNNEEIIFVDESWGKFSTSEMGQRGQRMITEKTFTSIVEQVIYVVVSKKTDKLIGRFPVMLFGQRNEHIKNLQDFLKTQGVFSVTQESTGYYGGITARAVWDFQLKEKVTNVNDINTLQGRRVGTLTINKINKILNK